MHFPQLQVQHLFHLLHALFDFLIAFFHIGIEKLPLPGEPDSFGCPLKKRGAQAPLQSLQGLAHRRLGYGELVCGAGDTSQLCGIVKYLMFL